MDFKQFYKTINFDIDNEIRTGYQATQGDTKSRGLLVDLIVGGVKTPVTTETMKFFALKPDGTKVMTAGVKEGTGFRIDFTNQTFAVPGVLLCTLVLYGTNGEKIADKKFKMTVDESLEDGAIISKDERGILDKAFELAEEVVPGLTNIESRFQTLTASQQQDAEVIDARDGELSLGAKIRGIDEQLAQMVTNVKSFGAKGDGATNDSLAFQEANDYLVSQGGGTLFIPTGTFMVNFILDSNIIVKGSGVNATFLKSVPNSNKDVIQGRNFNTLTGKLTATENEGVRFIQINDLTVDGNKANNTSGYGIRIWGCYWQWENIFVQNCASGGIHTEFSTHSSPTLENARGQVLETMFRNIKVLYCDGNAWDYDGPHDSIIDFYIAVGNTGWALYQNEERSFLTGENWNTWLNGHGFYVGAGLAGHDIVADGANVGIGIEFSETSANSRIVNGRFSGFDDGIILKGSLQNVKATVTGCGLNNGGSAVVIDKLSSSFLELNGVGNNNAIEIISEIDANHYQLLLNIPDDKTTKKGAEFRSNSFVNMKTTKIEDSYFQFPSKTIKSGGWTVQIPQANGTLLTNEMIPTTASRAGVLMQPAIADSEATDIEWLRSDVNNILNKLRASGVISY